MPLYFINQDITKVVCDAIVNAANNSLLGGGGVDGAIHKAAGEELLRECRTLGGCDTGDAKITKGYGLPCKYVIHTVGPIWHGGSNGEESLLKLCYRNSLSLAKSYGCDTVAFPVISSGAFGYPINKAFSVAIEAISEFLYNNEMTVYIVIYDKKDYKAKEGQSEAVREYIQNNYLPKKKKASVKKRVYMDLWFNGSIEDSKCYEGSSLEELLSSPLNIHSDNILELLNTMDEGFVVTLLKLIDKKGITDVECYKKANVSKQTWYKIMNDKHYKPSKNTVLSFAIALELSLEETKSLLSTVGFALSKSSKFDIIIEYFLLKGEYDIFLINETLFKFDQVCLGV